MPLWGRRQQGPRGAASADQIEAVAQDAMPGGMDERGIPPVNQRSYQSRGQMVAVGAGVLALLALMWMINRPNDKPQLAKNDPMSTKDQRFDEGAMRDSGIAPPVPRAPPPTVDVNPFEPPRPPTPGTIEIVPRIDGSRGPGAGGAPGGAPAQRQLTPLEKRMRSRTVIYEDRAPGGSAGLAGAGGRGFISPASAAQAIPGLPGLMSDGSLAPAAALPLPFGARAAVPRAPAMPLDGGVGASVGGEPGSADTGGGPGAPRAGAPASRGDEGSLSELLRPTRLDGASATRFPDRRLMMAQGKLIDCVLDTAISTVVAGMAKCSLTRDVYGEDGKVVLLDRGTELTGEYRSNLRVGQTRLGIIWNRAKTPTGVVIALTSPATDSLGRGGVDGYLDSHFWERYGASIMLSSLDDALAIIANRARDNGTVYIPPNINRTGRDAAAVALEQNIRIPPTIVKNQGEHIAVAVARDLDFRTVYGYRAAPGAGH